MEKTPTSMTSMQSLLEELVELLRGPQAVVRFKMSEGGGRRCQASEDSTLDAAGEHAVPEALRSPPDPRSVEPPIGEIETTHGQGESPGLQFSEGIKWPFPKDAVAGWLVAVRPWE